MPGLTRPLAASQSLAGLLPLAVPPSFRDFSPSRKFFPKGLDFCGLIYIITHRQPFSSSPQGHAMSRDLSSFRRQLRELHQQLPPLLETFLTREPLLPGSLYTLRRRCGKPTCHCAEGELHASTVLSYRGQGRPRNITPPPEKVSAVQKLTDDYRQFRQARTQLLRLQRQILKLIDGIEAARVQEGERRFQKLRSSFPSHPRR